MVGQEGFGTDGSYISLPASGSLFYYAKQSLPICMEGPGDANYGRMYRKFQQQVLHGNSVINSENVNSSASSSAAVRSPAPAASPPVHRNPAPTGPPTVRGPPVTTAVPTGP